MQHAQRAPAVVHECRPAQGALHPRAVEPEIGLDRPATRARQRQAQPQVQDGVAAAAHAVGIDVELAAQRHFGIELGHPRQRRRLEAEVHGRHIVQRPQAAAALLVEAKVGPQVGLAAGAEPDSRLQLALDNLVGLLVQPAICQGTDLVHAQVRLEFVQFQLGAAKRQRASAQPAVEIDVGLEHARLRHKTVVVHKTRRARLQLQLVPPFVADAGEFAERVAAVARGHAGAARHRLFHEAGAGLRVHQQPQGLLAVAAPLAVKTCHLVAAGVAITALRDERAHHRVLAMPARAHHAGQGAPGLRVFGRLVGAAAQHYAALLVAQAHGGGVGAGVAPGGAQAPFRVGHGARIKCRQRQSQHVRTLEEKAAFFRQAQGDAAGARGRGFVDFHLREIGIDGGVEHPVGARPSIDLQAHAGAVAALAPRFIAVAVGTHGQFRLEFHEAAVAHRRHRVAHAAHVLQQRDVAQRAVFERGAGEQQAIRVRHAALDHHAPGLALGIGKAQVRQRPADLHGIAVGQPLDRRVDRKIRPQVRLVQVGAIDAVAEHAGDIHAHELRRAAMSRGVEPHADKVLVQAHLVAPREGAAHALGRVVPGADAEHQRAVVDQQLHRGAKVGRRRLAVGGEKLVEGVEHGGGAPRVVIERAIDAQGGGAVGQHGWQWRNALVAIVLLHSRHIAGGKHGSKACHTKYPEN